MKNAVTILLAILLGGTTVGHASRVIDTAVSQGVQVYECSDASSGAPAWVLVSEFDPRLGRLGTGTFRCDVSTVGSRVQVAYRADYTLVK